MLNTYDVIAILGVLLPVLAPFVGWGFQRLAAMLPANRQSQLSSLAELVVHGVQQQANGGWSNEEKYAAAEQGLVMLAGKAGFKVSSDEARYFIEAAVLLGKSFGALQTAQPVAAPSPAPNESTDSPETAVDMPIPAPVEASPELVASGTL